MRTQCFSVTRKKDGGILVHNREEEEKEFIQKEFFNQEAIELSKTEAERFQDYQEKKDKEPKKPEPVRKPIELINEEEIDNVE